MAPSFTMRIFDSNKSKRVSATGSIHQVADIQIEVLKIIPEKTISQAVAGTLAEVLVTKKLEKYVDATEDNFEIDLDYSSKQRITELSYSNEESLSSTYGGGVSSLYTAISRLKTD